MECNTLDEFLERCNVQAREYGESCFVFPKFAEISNIKDRGKLRVELTKTKLIEKYGSFTYKITYIGGKEYYSLSFADRYSYRCEDDNFYTLMESSIGVGLYLSPDGTIEILSYEIDTDNNTKISSYICTIFFYICILCIPILIFLCFYTNYPITILEDVTEESFDDLLEKINTKFSSL